ncbi:hypothetical protein E4H12_05315 [Candidatus Thorarchaeota archaeon]|nr:MAG: hypothetical protein E4H12_05315 [Candidatus Thorarchaeota archaeon]
MKEKYKQVILSGAATILAITPIVGVFLWPDVVKPILVGGALIGVIGLLWWIIYDIMYGKRR